MHSDLTLVTRGMSKHAHNWQVSEKETLSRHKYIQFEVDDKRVKKKRKTGKILINEEQQAELLRNKTDVSKCYSPEEMIDLLQDILVDSCNRRDLAEV
mgnify:CR=1 FL=1